MRKEKEKHIVLFWGTLPCKDKNEIEKQLEREKNEKDWSALTMREKKRTSQEEGFESGLLDTYVYSWPYRSLHFQSINRQCQVPRRRVFLRQLHLQHLQTSFPQQKKFKQEITLNRQDISFTKVRSTVICVCAFVSTEAEVWRQLLLCFSRQKTITTLMTTGNQIMTAVVVTVNFKRQRRRKRVRVLTKSTADKGKEKGGYLHLQICADEMRCTEVW